MYKTIKHIILAFLLTIGGFTSMAQQGDWRITLNLADSLMQIGSIYTAIDYYKAVIKQGNEISHIHYKLAHAYYAARNYEKAREYFQKTYDDSPKKFPHAQYYLALMLKVDQEYMDAYDIFENIKSNYKGPNQSKYIKWSRTEMEACLQGEKSIKNPEKVKITRLNNTINTNHSEMSVAYLNNNRIVYTAIKTEGILTKDFMQYSKLYVAAKANKEWTHIKEYIQFDVNGNEHLAHLCISPTGKAMYYTTCKTNKNLKLECVIHRSKYDKNINGWGDPIVLGNRVNVKNYISSHPTIDIINDTTEVLYFTSNRPGGVGGFDIWFSIWKNGEFTSPVNVGKKVNTNHDEFTPFYDHKNSTLYFSSKGHLGYGGYDIFKSTGEGKKWTTPENLNYPINSSYDDLYFVLNKSEGFLASNREGSLSPSHPHCCDDLYSFEIQDTSIVHAKINLLYEEYENKPYEGEVEVSLFKLDKKDRTEIKIDQFTTDRNEIELKLKPKNLYRIKVYNNMIRYFYSGYVKFDTYDSKANDSINRIIKMRQIILNKPYNLNIKYAERTSVRLDEIGKNQAQPLIKFLRDNPDIIIELASHTDNIVANHKKISEERAKEIKEYLIERGISSKSILNKGYGSSRPLAPNQNKDDSQNIKGQKINDRIEYKIIGGTVD